jgi:hypothetical protein
MVRSTLITERYREVRACECWDDSSHGRAIQLDYTLPVLNVCFHNYRAICASVLLEECPSARRARHSKRKKVK